MFTQPLKVNEVIKATRSAEKCYLDKIKEYKYKNDTLIELLEISEEEQSYMTTIISKAEYKRRNNEYNKKKYYNKLKLEGKLTKKEEISQRRAKIKSLRKQGFKNKEIALMLELPIKTLERHITIMKKDGLL